MSRIFTGRTGQNSATLLRQLSTKCCLSRNRISYDATEQIVGWEPRWRVSKDALLIHSWRSRAAASTHRWVAFLAVNKALFSPNASFGQCFPSRGANQETSSLTYGLVIDCSGSGPAELQLHCRDGSHIEVAGSHRETRGARAVRSPASPKKRLNFLGQ